MFGEGWDKNEIVKREASGCRRAGESGVDGRARVNRGGDLSNRPTCGPHRVSCGRDHPRPDDPTEGSSDPGPWNGGYTEADLVPDAC